MAICGEVKDPSDRRSFGTARNIERLFCCVSLDGCPLLNLRLSIGGFCAKDFLQCLYSCWTILLELFHYATYFYASLLT